MRGGSALGGDEGEHLVEIQQRRVGGGEILRDEDERMPRLRHTRSRDAPQPRDDALRDVVEVGGALAQVAAHGGELVAERGERLEHRALAGLAVCEARADLVGERRVLGHHRLRLEDVLRRTARLLGAILELPGDGAHGLIDARALGGLADRAGLVGGGGEGLGHAGHRALRDAQADADPAHLGACHSAHAASWSVVSSSLSESSTLSAFSPSAVRVT